MIVRQHIFRGLVVASLAALSVAGAVAPATAQTPQATATARSYTSTPVPSSPQATGKVAVASDHAHPAASWIGACDFDVRFDWAGGWCDGNGPNWNYRAWIRCVFDGYLYGPWHWAGDRNGSYVHCPRGWALYGGLQTHYFG